MKNHIIECIQGKNLISANIVVNLSLWTLDLRNTTWYIQERGLTNVNIATWHFLQSTNFRSTKGHAQEKGHITANIVANLFLLALNLKIHSRVHAGVKPRQCQNCNKTFRYPSSLWKHIRVHCEQNHFSIHLNKAIFGQNSDTKDSEAHPVPECTAKVKNASDHVLKKAT